MRNKFINTVIAALLMACMAGCGADHAEEQFAEGAAMEYAYTGTGNGFEDTWQTEALVMTPEQQQTENLVMTPEQQQTEIPVAMPEQGQGKAVQGLDTELFDGRSISIWNGKENTLMALKEDTLSLYDVVSAQIKAETKTKDWNMVTLYPYEDGYCVIGEIIKGNPSGNTGSEEGLMFTEAVGGDDREYIAVFYNNSLKEVREIMLDDIVPDAMWAAWAVSCDGTMLGYYDQWDGLNLYDLENKKKQKLLDIGKDGKCASLLTIDKLFFEGKKGRLVFTGQTDQNGITAASWGRIGTDGTGFENHVLEYNLGMATGYSEGKLLLGEDSIFFKNRMGVINTETGKAVYHANTEGNLPVSGPFFSDDGTVYATAALGTNQMEVSVWRTADFSLLYKEVIRDDREEMFYRSPQICLFPELRACIVCMGGHNDIPQKAVLLNY